MGGWYGVRKREDGAQGSSFWFSVPYRPDTELEDDELMSSRLSPTTSLMSKSLSERAFSLMSEENDGPLEETSRDVLRLNGEGGAASRGGGGGESDTKEGRENSNPVLEDFGLLLSLPPPPLPPARVLLVDDSNMIQKATTRALEKGGFRVSNAFNGMECLKLLKAAKESGDLYAVVLLDLQMPVLDGLETIKRIREEERLSDLEAGIVPVALQDAQGAAIGAFPTSWAVCNSGRRQYVIGLSANSDQESIGCVAAAGTDNFIAKPLKVSNLRKFCEDQIIL
jgi:CheY-like chemotaxis protein